MKVSRPITLFLSFALLGGLLGALGCADIGLGSLANPPSVSAQQIYSNQDLSGTYAYTESGHDASQPFTGSGTLHFDGQGNMTGTIIVNYLQRPACTFSVAGQLSINSSGGGTGTFTSSGTSTACTPTSGSINVQAAGQGQALLLSESDGQQLASGTAIRQ
jgi:hypothetical protein